MDLRTQLIGFEGFRNEAYQDTLGIWSIGCGHADSTVHEGLVWTDDQVNRQLDADIAEKLAQCRSEFPWFDSLNAPRQAVVVGMCFQLGMGQVKPVAKGMLAFQQTLAAMRDERWEDAAEGMRRSLWAKQTPRRAQRLAAQMATGEWQ